MGNQLSSFFQSGSALLNSNHRQLSEQTSGNVRFVFDTLRANPRIMVHRLQPVLSQINKVRAGQADSVVFDSVFDSEFDREFDGVVCCCGAASVSGTSCPMMRFMF